MKINFQKILSVAAGIVFLAFLILLPQILIQSTVKSVNLAVKLKNDVTRKKTGQPPIATIEPIEKVGFYHFLPGVTAYYLETVDQDASCLNCGAGKAENNPSRSADQVIADAQNAGAKIISLVDSDSPAANNFNLALAKAAKQSGLRTTMIFDGCLDLAALKTALPDLDAVEINLGDGENNFCAGISDSALKLAQAKIQAVVASGKHLEINDELTAASDTLTTINLFLAAAENAAGKNSIIHFTSAKGMTDASTTSAIITAREQALRAGFKYVYTGGFDYPPGENTYCADGTIALSRQNDFLLQNNLINDKCADGTEIPGTWN
ncbi:MAG TPA: hypothetical protein VMC41_02380 [Candidatus Nanoarchaeia archaeon]|nr:hypothetical protein [Candidatus Nanoarchaeia archaeon]